MDSFIFAFNSVSPIIAMVAIGYLLKRMGLISDSFSLAANKLVFRIFLPVMLFYNIYRIDDLSSFSPGFIVYAVAMIFVFFSLGALVSFFVTDKKERRGVIIQASFRSNYALIGIPIAESLFGAVGGAVAAVLSAFIVPILNVLAVITLSVFGGSKVRPSAKKIALDILKNPLICGVALGFVSLGVRAILVRLGVDFRITDIQPIEKVLSYLSNLATPIALLMLGARFEFSAVSSLRREIVCGTLMRTVVAPLVGLGIAFLFFRDTFRGEHFAVFVAMFSTPVAVSSVPMTQEMKGDLTLAGQLVVWTTLISGISIFVSVFILRLIGIF